ncbi:MAG: FtsX-like permease family protein [Chloroflexota bacterium]
MSTPTYGGQAVIEGVMMRGVNNWSLAVRKPDETIALHSWPLVSWMQRYPVLKLPILRGVVALVAAGGALVGVLLVLGAAFTIANVVRLTILLHRDEIDVLRLVGAPEMLIRGPFVLGAMAQGLAGGLLALGTLRLLFEGLLRWVAATQNVLLGVFVARFLPAWSGAALVGGGLLAGLLGGAFAVRKKNIPG